MADAPLRGVIFIPPDITFAESLWPGYGFVE